MGYYIFTLSKNELTSNYFTTLPLRPFLLPAAPTLQIPNMFLFYPLRPLPEST